MKKKIRSTKASQLSSSFFLSCGLEILATQCGKDMDIWATGSCIITGLHFWDWDIPNPIHDSLILYSVCRLFYDVVLSCRVFIFSMFVLVGTTLRAANFRFTNLSEPPPPPTNDGGMAKDPFLAFYPPLSWKIWFSWLDKFQFQRCKNVHCNY